MIQLLVLPEGYFGIVGIVVPHHEFVVFAKIGHDSLWCARKPQIIDLTDKGKDRA